MNDDKSRDESADSKKVGRICPVMVLARFMADLKPIQGPRIPMSLDYFEECAWALRYKDEIVCAITPIGFRFGREYIEKMQRTE